MIRDIPPWESPSELVLGSTFEKYVRAVKKRIGVTNDHYPLLILGDTNSGKSNLLMTLYDIIDPEGTIEFVAFTKEDFARAQAMASEKGHPRFVGYDEADLSGAEWMTKWNNEVIKLLMKVRYSRIFWAFCNPSADTMDKRFVKNELIKAVIVIKDKTKGHRAFYLYLVADLLRYLKTEKDADLTRNNLTKSSVAKKYAYLLSWSRAYQGHLKEAYEDKKKVRTSDIHEEFRDQWVRRQSANEAGMTIGCDPRTVSKYAEKLLGNGLLSRGARKPTGRWAFTQEDVELLKDHILREAGLGDVS